MLCARYLNIVSIRASRVMLIRVSSLGLGLPIRVRVRVRVSLIRVRVSLIRVSPSFRSFKSGVMELIWAFFQARIHDFKVEFKAVFKCHFLPIISCFVVKEKRRALRHFDLKTRIPLKSDIHLRINRKHLRINTLKSSQIIMAVIDVEYQKLKKTEKTSVEVSSIWNQFKV